MTEKIQHQASWAELRYLQGAFNNQSEIAALLNLHRSTVHRWGRRAKPDSDNELKIAGLRFVVLRLAKMFKPETAEKWLLGINAHLRNQRPIDLVKQNRFAEVLSAIEQSEANSYA